MTPGGLFWAIVATGGGLAVAIILVGLAVGFIRLAWWAVIGLIGSKKP